jgi:outer membrane protein OmpA-like peptidoglycan-associated protein
MNTTKCSIAALLMGFAAGAAPAAAQTYNGPWAEIEAFSVMAGVGGGGGDGQLNLPNLGTNCVYPFKVTGYGAGIQVNVSKISASGPVSNLTKLEDFPGTYTATGGEVTLVAGGGGASLKNNANNVSLNLASQTVGIGLGVSAQGLTIDMPVPPVNAPRVYVLEFGANKWWVNPESRSKLNELVDAWKCRFVTIDVEGQADTVANEADNMKLSELRAETVRNYLVGAGIVPSRITTHVAPERSPQERTTGVGGRTYRVAVVNIH